MDEPPSDDDDDRFDARVLYAPPKNPKWEAIEIEEVDRRIRVALPDLPERALEGLAIAVVMSVPTPPELGEYLRNAISALEGVLGVFDETAANRQSFPLFSEAKEDVFHFVGRLQAIRDRTYRGCEHDDIEKGADGSSTCRDCKAGWPPGLEVKPGRLILPRAHSALVKGRKRPGKAAFFYLATEVCRRHEMTKATGMRVAAKLIDLFWPVDTGSYESDDQRESAHREGKESARKNRFLEAEGVESYNFGHSLRDQLIWVPYRSAGDSPA